MLRIKTIDELNKEFPLGWIRAIKNAQPRSSWSTKHLEYCVEQADELELDLNRRRGERSIYSKKLKEYISTMLLTDKPKEKKLDFSGIPTEKLERAIARYKPNRTACMGIICYRDKCPYYEADKEENCVKQWGYEERHNAFKAELERRLKGENMDNNTEVLKRIENAERELALAKEALEEPKKPKTFEVKTPIDYEGDIIFNSNKQALYVSEGVWGVTGGREYTKDHKDDFLWVGCDKADLESGDTAYRWDWADTPDFDTESSSCKIYENGKYVWVSEHGISTDNANFSYWFKLVAKEDL